VIPHLMATFVLAAKAEVESKLASEAIPYLARSPSLRSRHLS